MAGHSFAKPTTAREVFGYLLKILGPEKNYYVLAVVYGIGISVLSLALPVSVQMLVNTVAYTGLPTPLLVLTLTLFGLLLASGLLNALRIHLIDLFGRRFYARMVAEIAVRSVYALNPFFSDYSKGALFNRYFDIIIVQKTLPNLLVGGFTIVLQAAVGFILVSSYHPWFLFFNLLIIAAVWIIWLIWSGRAIRSSVDVSHKKHAAAAWLEGLGASNGFFKSPHHISDAMRRTEDATAAYMKEHVRHFRHHFAQTIAFLVLYAIASAALLGLGGWLVIQGQLTLGQLVAAELVLSVVLFGISQLGIYMAYFYEVCAAIEELSLFFDVEQEDPDEHYEPFTGDGSIDFVEARGDARGQDVTLNFSIGAGDRVLTIAESHGLQREVTDFLKRHVKPEGGYVTLGSQDIATIHVHELRQQVIVLDRPNAIEMTINDYLRLCGRKGTSQRILEVLKVVGLDTVINRLPDGMDTYIASTGWPLTISESMQLKLAAALIAQPKVLVLSQLFDVMTDRELLASLDKLHAEAGTTIIYFTSRPRDLHFDHFLFLGYEKQTYYTSFAALCAENGYGESTRPAPSLALSKRGD